MLVCRTRSLMMSLILHQLRRRIRQTCWRGPLQGNVTLPVLYALQNPTLEGQLKLINSETTEKQLKPVIEHLKQTDAIDRSIRVSEMYLKKHLNSSINFRAGGLNLH